jgi:ribosomal protein S18 acetylase RimI-like enzyme
MNSIKNLKFNSILDYPRGILRKILTEAYEPFHQKHPEFLDENMKKFIDCDEFFYNNPKIGNNCAFVYEYDGETAGMSCWDPRPRPTVEIGHNCILPKFRGLGLGTYQMKEVLKHLKEKGFTHAKVSTGQMDFFIPAQKMYEAAGFKEVKRDDPKTSGKNMLNNQVYYEMELV